MTPWSRLRPTKKLQNILSSSLLKRRKSRFYKVVFPGKRRHRSFVCFPCYEIKAFTIRIETIKGMTECVCWVSIVLEFGHFDTKSFRYRSTRYKSKSFRDIIKVYSIQLNLYVLNCFVVRPAGAKIAISVNQWRCFQAPTVMNTLSVRDSFEALGQKLRKSLTPKCLRILFMIASIRVESLNNKLSDKNTVESRSLQPSVSRTSRYLEPNLDSIEFASLKLYNFTPDFSNPRFLEPPDNSNKLWLPWDKLTPDHSNLRKFPNHLVRMSITFTSSMLFLRQLLIEMLGLFCEYTWHLDGVSRYLHGEFSLF